jgi:hypothetical protein
MLNKKEQEEKRNKKIKNKINTLVSFSAKGTSKVITLT